MIYTIDDIRNKIQPIMEHYQIPAAYLFGSYARGEADDSSDIDLMVVVEGSIAEGFAFYDMLDELEETLDKDVDLVTYEGLSHNKTFIGRMVFNNAQKDKVVIYETRTFAERPQLS